ncbi:hypothetical protein KP509_15G045600 [Ceratopteris richardii]|nr:hypothetical protein KP509_15G045600 [Ceratopteris richardii]
MTRSMNIYNRRLLQTSKAPAASWNWKDAMLQALKDNNKMGNIMINRVGQLWWDRSVPKDAIEYDMNIDDVTFHVCTFKGAAFFQTMGWYGWENWAFQGRFTRVDKFTVTFS